MSISKSFGINLDNFNTKAGVITLMYHRFDENKYPSTNVRNEIFIEQLKLINSTKLEFITFKKFEEITTTNIDKRYILLTIDDAFESFYLNAWPILKSKQIPFILFVSTREVGKRGYMTWDQIRELDKSGLVSIGNHSHSHEYLIDWSDDKIINDLKTSINIFKTQLNYSPKVFSYPFGEYSNNLKKIVYDLNFKYAFGQHSGVVDRTKNFLELPRFPINEKYGELKRFQTILSTLPFPYESITPEERYLEINENPPNIKIKFFKDLINIQNINCYSNEGNIWRKSDLKFINEYELNILIAEKFKSERGRVNCSIKDKEGGWRWLGIQYVIAEY